MSYSIISQLGFMPPELDVDAVELSGLAGPEHFAEAAYPYPIVMGSDAHKPDQIGSASIAISGGSPDFSDIARVLLVAGNVSDGRVATVLRN